MRNVHKQAAPLPFQPIQSRPFNLHNSTLPVPPGVLLVYNIYILF